MHIRPDLAPAAFHQNIAAIAANIVVGYPVLVGSRRHLPASGRPYVSIAVPTMISIDPDVIAARGLPAMFDDSDWRTKTNYDVGGCGAESQRASENNSD
jgi:hypothetical protein